MVNPISNDQSALAIISSPSTRKEESTSTSSLSPNDYVSISDHGLKKLQASFSNTKMIRDSFEGRESEEKSGSSWKLSSGLEEGTFTLKNGNKQTVAIKGNSLEIEEFKDGKLIKTVTGSITDKGASLKTEYYDSKGEVSQSIQTEIFEGESKSGWSLSSMSRSVQWFEDGKLKGSMQDNMLLNSWDSTAKVDKEDAEKHVSSLLMQGTEELAMNVEDLSKKLTAEKHIASYYANFNEYGVNGKLSRNTVLEHEGRYQHLSNRSSQKLRGMEERSTQELFHNTKFSMQVKDYDSSGELIRDSRFSDVQKDIAAKPNDGKQEQTVDVSWYSGGELVKRSSGSMIIEETDGHSLPKRPGFMETFGLSTEQYLGGEPQSAMELMNQNLLETSAESDFFMDGLVTHVSGGDYSTAEGIAQNGGLNQPYSMSWTDELYKDGDLAVRQTDTEGAKETSFYQHERGLLFRKGGALTENANPVVQRESSHEHEVFDEGELTSHQFMESKETVDVDHKGPDKLLTDTIVSQGVGNQEVTTVMKNEVGLLSVDSNPNAAAKGMSNEMEQTLTDFYNRGVSMNEPGIEENPHSRLRFDYQSWLTD